MSLIADSEMISTSSLSDGELLYMYGLISEFGLAWKNHAFPKKLLGFRQDLKNQGFRKHSLCL